MSEIDVKYAKVVRRLDSINSKQQMIRVLHRIGALLEYKTKENIVRQGLVDHGYLLNSIKYGVELTDSGGVVTVGSYGVKYAAIHESGDDIYPRRARALTIPVAPWAKYHRARDFKLIRIGEILVDPKKLPKGRGGTRSLVIPKDAIGFRLAKKVTIPARPYMGPAVEQALPRILRILSIESATGNI